MVLHWQAFLHLYCVWFCGMFLVSIVLGWYYKSSFHEAWLYYHLLHQQLIRLNLHKLFCFSFKFLVYSVSYSTSVELSLLTTDQRTTSTPQQAEPKLTATPFSSPDDCWIVDYQLLIPSVNQQLSAGDILQPNSFPQASLLNCMPCVRSVFCSVLGQTPKNFKEKDLTHSYVYPFLAILNNF